MELARVTSKGQITIPVEIRKRLDLKEGDKVLFIEEDGRIIFANSSYVAFKDLQKEMDGESARVGIRDENDVMNLVKEMRRGN